MKVKHQTEICKEVVKKSLLFNDYFKVYALKKSTTHGRGVVYLGRFRPSKIGISCFGVTYTTLEEIKTSDPVEWKCVLKTVLSYDPEKEFVVCYSTVTDKNNRVSKTYHNVY